MWKEKFSCFVSRDFTFSFMKAATLSRRGVPPLSETEKREKEGKDSR